MVKVSSIWRVQYNGSSKHLATHNLGCVSLDFFPFKLELHVSVSSWQALVWRWKEGEILWLCVVLKGEDASFACQLIRVHRWRTILAEMEMWCCGISFFKDRWKIGRSTNFLVPHWHVDYGWTSSRRGFFEVETLISWILSDEVLILKFGFSAVWTFPWKAIWVTCAPAKVSFKKRLLLIVVPCVWGVGSPWNICSSIAWWLGIYGLLFYIVLAFLGFFLQWWSTCFISGMGVEFEAGEGIFGLLFCSAWYGLFGGSVIGGFFMELRYHV